MVRNREEVINVYLAECLQEMGVKAIGEQIEVKQGIRSMPDVMVDYRGLRCIIEGKFNDVANPRAAVQQDASGRVRDGIVYMAIGVVYPTELRNIQGDELLTALSEAMLDFCICSETNYAEPEWHKGKLSALIDQFSRSYDILAQDDALGRAVERIRYGMSDLVFLLGWHQGPIRRIAETIGISLDAPIKAKEENEDD